MKTSIRSLLASADEAADENQEAGLSENPMIRSLGVGEFLDLSGWLVIVASLAIALYTTLFVSSAFADNRYNRGLVAHSVLPQSTHFLETSIVHMFFQAYPIPRVEDWHRGLSIVALVLWARVVGTNHAILLRLPNVLWVFAWLYLAIQLYFVAHGHAKASLRKPRSLPWSLSILIPVLVLPSWSQFVQRNAFLDDAPAAVCILAMLLILIGTPKLGLRASAGMGLLAGLSYLMKDLYLLWLPTGVAVLVLYLAMKPDPPPRASYLIRHAAAFTIAFLVVAAIKLAWSQHDLGSPLANPSQYWGFAYYFGTRPVDEHYPFFLYNDLSYRSPFTLAGSIPSLVARDLKGPFIQLLVVFAGFKFAWLTVLLAVIRPVRERLTAQARRVVAVVAVILVAYSGFFLTGVGSVTQTRYWIVPLTLFAVVGTEYLDALIREGLRLATGRRILLARSVVALVAVALVCITPIDFVLNLRSDPPPESIAGYNALASAMASNDQDAAILDVNSGIYFWSLHPAARVVAFPVAQLTRLDNPALSRFLATYGVRYALYSNPSAIRRLQAIGFRVSGQEGDDVLLER